MFTLQQSKAAHAKVKNGADFPAYIQEIKSFGLKSYVYSVIDGTIIYYGADGYKIAAPAIYEPKKINHHVSPNELHHSIAIHQQGQTDFFTFCEQVAGSGVMQWVIDTERMVCIYEDMNSKEIAREPIPDKSSDLSEIKS